MTPIPWGPAIMTTDLDEQRSRRTDGEGKPMLGRRGELIVRPQRGSHVIVELPCGPSDCGSRNAGSGRARDGAEGAAVQRKGMMMVSLLRMRRMRHPAVHPGHARHHDGLPREDRRGQQDRDTGLQNSGRTTAHRRGIMRGRLVCQERALE